MMMSYNIYYQRTKMFEQIIAKTKEQIESLTLKQIANDRDEIIEELNSLKIMVDDTLNLFQKTIKRANYEYKPKRYVSPQEVISAIKSGINTARDLKDNLDIKSDDLFSTLESLKEKNIVYMSTRENGEEYFYLTDSPLVCNICKKPTISFDIHHINGNTEDNSDENLLNLCTDCHKSIHGKRSNNPIYSHNPMILSLIDKYSKIWKDNRRESIIDDSGEEQ